MNSEYHITSRTLFGDKREYQRLCADMIDVGWEVISVVVDEFLDIDCLWRIHFRKCKT